MRFESQKIKSSPSNNSGVTQRIFLSDHKEWPRRKQVIEGAVGDTSSLWKSLPTLIFLLYKNGSDSSLGKLADS